MKFIQLIPFIFVIGCSSLNNLIPVEGVKKHSTFFNSSWRKNLDPVYDTGNLPIALNSPEIYDGIVFNGNNNGSFEAYDLESGRLLWKKKVRGEFHAKPTIYKKSVIYGTTDGRVYSHQYQTGKLNYELDLGASVESDGVVHDGRIFFHLRNHKIFSLDVKTGKVLWAYRRAVPFLTTLQRVSKPVIYKNRLYVGFADSSIAAFTVEDGSLLWEKKLSIGHKFIDTDATPFFYKGKLLVGSISGPLYVLKPTSGVLIRKIELTISRAPFELNNGLVVGTTSGDLVIFNQNLEVISTKKLFKNGALSSITKWKGGLLITSTTGKVFYLNEKTFNIEEKMSLGSYASAVFGKPATSDDKLALFSSRNRLYVYE